jgi:hypothetical protein
MGVSYEACVIMLLVTVCFFSIILWAISLYLEFCKIFNMLMSVVTQYYLIHLYWAKIKDNELNLKVCNNGVILHSGKLLGVRVFGQGFEDVSVDWA